MGAGVLPVSPKLTRWSNAAVHKLIENRPRSVTEADERSLHRALSGYDRHAELFVHAGLRDVSAALPRDPYDRIIEAANANFRSVLCPGFTDYFKVSGVYDKRHSKPKHGAFGRRFLEDADYRTDDPIKSILVQGEYRFEGCKHSTTYSTDGCFERLNQDDVLVASIGTPFLICSYLHHLEARNDAPYMKERTFSGIVHTGSETVEVDQTTHQYDGMWSFNKLKLHRQLRKRDALDTYDLNGLSVFVTAIRDVDRLVTGKMKDDPYYLVT